MAGKPKMEMLDKLGYFRHFGELSVRSTIVLSPREPFPVLG